MKATPLPGKQVLNPETNRFLDEFGENVSPDFRSFWLRREADGDVILTDGAEVVAVKDEWAEMLDAAKALNAEADKVSAEAEAMRAAAKIKDTEAVALRASASQKERAANAAVGGKAK